MAECSAPHVGKTFEGDSQVNGGGESKGAGGSGNMEEVRQIWRGEVVEGVLVMIRAAEFWTS